MGFDLNFPPEYLKAALLVCLLSVWLLAGLFAYLNHYTRRRYFTIWTAAWLFYSLWLTINYALLSAAESLALVMLKQWCVAISALFLLWGGLVFQGERVRQTLLGLFGAFLLLWSYLGTYQLQNSLPVQFSIFGLMGVSSVLAARCFILYRRKQKYVGASLLSVGFLLWGIYLAGYPLWESQGELAAGAFFSSAVLQLFIAVSMIILVLEEARSVRQLALDKIRTQKAERDDLAGKFRSTEERYRTLFEQAGEAIVIVSAEDLRLLELNQRAESLLGLKGSEATQRLLSNFIRDLPSNEGRTGKEWLDLVFEQRTLNLVGKDGGITAAEVSGAPIDYSGQPAYQIFLRPLTERWRLEQQLQQAEKLSALGQMISGVAHELNNPLAVIKGYLELILGHHELNPQTRADLEKVAHESNRAAKLVSTFLAFARQQPVKHQTVHLNALIHKIVELRKPELDKCGVELLLVLAPELPRTRANADQIEQVLLNLLNNALQAMPGSGRPPRLRISTESASGLIQVIIEDSGPGVPKHLEAKIFEPFFTTKDVGAGTGLGLSLAHTIMSDHCGRISFKPSSLGGAGFLLEFPVADPKSSEVSGEEKALSLEKEWQTETMPHATILVLDDEKPLAEMLGQMLTVIGHQPVLCHLPLKALELLEERDFDLILSDYRMPGLDGQQFYRMVTQKRPALAERFVFLTGDVANEETYKFLNSIGAPHLTKPFQLASVEKVIAEVLHSVRIHSIN